MRKKGDVDPRNHLARAGDFFGHVRLRPILRAGVTMMTAFLLALSLLVAAYLFYAMIRPERF
jgi:K+-transporting ATPase KdpF subunit